MNRTKCVPMVVAAGFSNVNKQTILKQSISFLKSILILLHSTRTLACSFDPCGTDD